MSSSGPGRRPLAKAMTMAVQQAPGSAGAPLARCAGAPSPQIRVDSKNRNPKSQIVD